MTFPVIAVLSSKMLGRKLSFLFLDSTYSEKYVMRRGFPTVFSRSRHEQITLSSLITEIDYIFLLDDTADARPKRQEEKKIERGNISLPRVKSADRVRTRCQESMAASTYIRHIGGITQVRIPTRRESASRISQAVSNLADFNCADLWGFHRR